MLFESQRLKMIVERLRELETEGAAPYQLLAYGEAVNRRFAEAVAEIALDARLIGILTPEMPPPGNRKTGRAAKRSKLH